MVRGVNSWSFIEISVDLWRRMLSVVVVVLVLVLVVEIPLVGEMCCWMFSRLLFNLALDDLLLRRFNLE